MDLDSEETGELDPCGIDASEEANSLPGIKHLFGIGRAGE